MNQDIRKQFPSLARMYRGNSLAYLDGPAGTQVPDQVIQAMGDYYRHSNANTHGYFITSKETDDIIHWTREQCAALLNAEVPECISFGANMTSLTYKLSRALSRMFEPGDEVVITQLDHEANRGPWLSLEQHGIIVKEIKLLSDGRLDYSDAADKITSKTKLVAAGWASNILGTVNDVAQLRKLSSEVGALFLIDAVHYAPHFSIDVQDVDCDFLLCSAYKFYGPHVGILYSKKGLLDTLPTDHLRTADQEAPGRIETGTLNHAALAGVGACIDYISGFGEGENKRAKLADAYRIIGEYERTLANDLWVGLGQIKGVTRYGTDFDSSQRCPTIVFRVDGHTPVELCKFLGEKGICAWDGHFYAIRATEVLGLEKLGGVTRMGIVVYNTKDEVNYTLNAVSDFIQSRS